MHRLARIFACLRELRAGGVAWQRKSSVIFPARNASYFSFSLQNFLAIFPPNVIFFHPSNIAIFSSRIHRILLEILPYRFRVESFTTSLRSKLRSLCFFFSISCRQKDGTLRD